jgi:hypothetical protein
MWKGALIWTMLVLLCGCGSARRLEIVDDDCPEADLKIYPGICGCSIPEERCLSLINALVHRYAFDGFGASALDDVSGADGAIFNAELRGTGQLELERSSELEQYVELPNGIISSLSSATFEAWAIWNTPPPLEADPFWERIFDFGVSTAGEDKREQGKSYIFLAPGEPSTVPPSGRTAYQKLVSEGEVRLNATEPFPLDTVFHVAVVVDAQAQELRLYLDGRAQGVPVPLLDPLSAIEDVNNWLGRSQYAVDTRFGGAFLEFRIYDAALTPGQLADSLSFGPSPGFLAARPLDFQDVSGSP